jgi:hypothetical protein
MTLGKWSWLLAATCLFVVDAGDVGLEVDRAQYLDLDSGTTHRQLQGLLQQQSEGASVKHARWTSPSNGTDVLSDPVNVVRCFNQTMCIQPYLQLQRSYDIYMCKHIDYGVRFFFLVREGLLLHPNVRLVDSPETAELIVYLPGSSAWSKSECGNL